MSHCDTVTEDGNDCARDINMRAETQQFIRIVDGAQWEGRDVLVNLQRSGLGRQGRVRADRGALLFFFFFFKELRGKSDAQTRARQSKASASSLFNHNQAN